MNPERKVYDDHDEQPVTRPDLRALEGGGEASEPKRNHLSAVPDKEGGASGGENSSKGLFNAGGDGDKASEGSSKSVSPRNLYNAEAVSAATPLVGGIRGGLSLNNLGSLWSTKKRRRWVIGGGIVGLVIGVSLFGLSFLSGPAQLVQLAAVLQHPLDGTSQASSNRLGKLLRFAGAQDIGETRVGQLGRQVLRPALSKLGDAGIEFKTNALGTESATIDPRKLATSFPELDGASASDQAGILAKHFDGISADQFIRQGDGTFRVDTSRMNSDSLKALKNDSLTLLGDGKIMTYIRGRVLAPYLGVTSLFHPLKKLATDKLKTLTSPAAASAEEEQRVQQDIADPVAQTEGTAGIRDSLKSKLNGDVADNIIKGVLIAGVLCSIRGAADDAIAFNHAAIVAPGVGETTDLVAVGEEVKYGGQDVTVQQVGAVEQGLTDSNGQTIWQGKALRALEGDSNPTGPDLPADDAQAFSGNTTANNIKKKLAIDVLGIDVTGLACSQAGVIIQVAISLAALVAAAPSGGTDLAAFAGAKGAETAATMGVFWFFQHQLANLLQDKAIIPAVLSGPLGGNIAAYSSRDAANVVTAASGGIALAGTATSAVTYQQQQQDEQQFRSESFFARMFDINDYRSLTGRLADSLSPRVATNVATAVNGFGSMWGGLLSNLSSIFTPKAHAATAYDWGFPLFGIPDDVLNDPNLSNPYDNANQVEVLLQGSGGQAYLDRATACFGVKIDPATGDITPGQAVDPNSQSYTDGHCSDTSDYNWKRMILFVFDTRTMQAAACYTGDDQSCQEVGYNTTSGTSSSPASGTTSSGCGGSGNYSALVSSGASFAGIDQGIDFVPSGSGGFDICAPAPGTITLADQTGHHFGRTSGQAEIIEKLDQPPNAPSSSQYIYYAEIIQINSGIQVGTHVNAGDIIGHNDQSPGIEDGWGTSATEGFMCPLSNDPTPCGRSFSDWITALSTGKVP